MLSALVLSALAFGCKQDADEEQAPPVGLTLTGTKADTGYKVRVYKAPEGKEDNFPEWTYEDADAALAVEGEAKAEGTEVFTGFADAEGNPFTETGIFIVAVAVTDADGKETETRYAPVEVIEGRASVNLPDMTVVPKKSISLSETGVYKFADMEFGDTPPPCPHRNRKQHGKRACRALYRQR